MNPTKGIARLAGIFFLLMVAFGLFAELFFRQGIFIPGDAVVTAGNILANGLLYRFGILSDILMSLCYLFTAIALYRLLVSVNKNLAQMMVLFAAAGSVLLLSNVLNELAPLTILTSGSYMGAFSEAELQALAMSSFDAYNHGYMIGQSFFALWVLPLGLLIWRSKFIPKGYGVLFIVEAACGLLSVAAHFLGFGGSVEAFLLIPGMFAEFAFLGWLLKRGIDESKLETAQV